MISQTCTRGIFTVLTTCHITLVASVAMTQCRLGQDAQVDKLELHLYIQLNRVKCLNFLEESNLKHKCRNEHFVRALPPLPPSQDEMLWGHMTTVLPHHHSSKILSQIASTLIP